MAPPQVSVIIPTYNRRQQLERALHSVREQTFKDFETIVVDDASTDGTRERMEKHVDRSLRYIRHDENRGAAAARNTGIDASEGKYLAFLDSDDEWRAEKLERQVQRMEGGAIDVGLVYTGATVKGNPDREPSRLVPSKRGNILRDQLTRDWIHPTSTWMVRKRCFDEVGGFKSEFEPREDYEMNVRICEKYRVDYIDEPMTVMHNQGEDRISKNMSKRIEAHKRIIREVLGPKARRTSWGKPTKVFGTQYFTIARDCQRLGDYEAARKYFRESLSWDPFNPKTLTCYLLAFVNRDLPAFYYNSAGETDGG